MGDVITYICKKCGKTRKLKNQKTKEVLCCEQVMEPLPPCEKTITAEHERLKDKDLPCDNGVH